MDYEPELLPCPFCGRENMWQQSGHYGWAIECNCGAMGPTEPEDDEDGKLNAILAWNKRI